MSETPDQEPATAPDDDDGPSGPRRRFNPRLALIYCLGAVVIVLAFAVVMSFLHDDGSSSKVSDSATVIDGGQIKLGDDDSTFTATTLPPSGLLTMKGEVTDLASVVDGKPTMINMFSQSCTACRTEMPALERLHKAIGDEVQVVGVNLGDSASGTADLVKKTGVTYRIVRDPKLRLVTPLNITAQPMTLWVDAQGRITGHRYGALTDTEMRLAMKNYLGVTVPTS